MDRAWWATGGRTRSNLAWILELSLLSAVFCEYIHPPTPNSPAYDFSIHFLMEIFLSGNFGFGEVSFLYILLFKWLLLSVSCSFHLEALDLMLWSERHLRLFWGYDVSRGWDSLLLLFLMWTFAPVEFTEDFFPSSWLLWSLDWNTDVSHLLVTQCPDSSWPRNPALRADSLPSEPSLTSRLSLLLLQWLHEKF